MSSLYQKYRPKLFSEISGQANTIRTLTNAINNDRVGHAFLLTGPRGTGKTTIARVFAKAINCQSTVKSELPNVSLEPCNKCESCKLILDEKALDLVEIDAASHTGVDNIRNLKESIPLPPSALKFKVYIIDEVHMLSIGAFNALLKTLEEPPAHAIFILATTELHKVPETIISRCQRFDITPLTQEQIINRLEQISKKEKVEIEKEALETIALEAEGGMRDAESLLSQIISLEDKKVTSEEVSQILGTSSKRQVVDFTRLLSEKNTPVLLEKIDQLQNEGINLNNFNKGLVAYLRGLIIIQTNKDSAKTILQSFSDEQLKEAEEISSAFALPEILQLIEIFQKSLHGLKESSIPQLPLELAVIEFCIEHEGINSGVSSGACLRPEPEAEASVQPPTESPAASAPQPTKNIKEKPEPKKEESAAKDKSAPSQIDVTLDIVLDKWSDILEEIKPHNHSIHAFLKNCTPCGIKEDSLFIKTKYDFYKDKLSETNNRLTVQKVVAKIIEAPLKVAFLTEQEAQVKNFKPSNKKDEGNPLHDAMQMMGGRIVKS